MALDLRDCTFVGAALPEPFVKFELESLLTAAKLLPKATGDEGRALQESWDFVRRKLRDLGDLEYGHIKVANNTVLPLTERLGYSSCQREEPVNTREGDEDGGWLMSDDSARLRVWAVDYGVDLDAPNRRGRAYRFSPARVAHRVLLAKSERIGLISNGIQLRVLFADPARAESHIGIGLTRAGGWRGATNPPDSYRLLLALASPRGVAELSKLTERARLSQAAVTKKLREQAKAAILGFIQSLYEDGRNKAAFAGRDGDELARQLWREGLIVVYRLLFVLKLESAGDPARAFSFKSSTAWRNTYSPNTALGPIVELARKGLDTGALLSDGVRTLFRLFEEGLTSSELTVSRLGGALFGPEATPLLHRLQWSESAVAILLDSLLWTPKSGKIERQRVFYGALDVEDLGRVYEALLELEPGIANEAMCRLRRSKLEVVVPAAQGISYKTTAPSKGSDDDDEDEEDQDDGSRKKKVEWIEEIPAGRFFLRVGLGRKTTGSYYTPDAFVRFLVEKTLAPLIAGRSPPADPNPAAILALNVLDPSTGSGHFLVGACRYLGEKLYEACRLCDERAAEAEEQAEKKTDPTEREALRSRARLLRERVERLPDPTDELAVYLPSRVLDSEHAGISQEKALAICRRLAAVHCLYGVDRNPLAVELAKLSLWLESYAEGLPLTFLDHRILCADSLVGPSFDNLLTYPGSGKPLDPLYAKGVTEKLRRVLGEALAHVRDLEASVGKDSADIEQKRAAKERLDRALLPLKRLADAWTGGVMLGPDCDDEGYEVLLRAIAEKEDPDVPLTIRPTLGRMIKLGRAGVSFDLTFPEVFYPGGEPTRGGGFDVVVGNPPWDAIRRADDQFFGGFDFRALAGRTKKEKKQAQATVLTDPQVSALYAEYVAAFQRADRVADRLFDVHRARIGTRLAGRGFYDAFMLFAERAYQLGTPGTRLGLVLPSSLYINEGATGVRRLLFDSTTIETFFVFKNARELFEIHRQTKFVVLVAQQTGAPTPPFPCLFDLEDTADLVEVPRAPLMYSRELIEATGGQHLAMLEATSQENLDIARACYLDHSSIENWFAQGALEVSQEVNMTYDDEALSDASAERLGGDLRDPDKAKELAKRSKVVLHEGKTFHQFDDHWPEASIAAVVDLLGPNVKAAWKTNSASYRLAIRDVTNAENERTAIAAILPPSLVGNTALVEVAPAAVANETRLAALVVINSFVFDWCARQKVTRHLNKFILNALPVPTLEEDAREFVVHAALRLTCNHDGYQALWRAVVGDEWREQSRRGAWPVLSEKERWPLRARADAVICMGYGLSRHQYEQALAAFEHTACPAAPLYCLEAYDELAKQGIRKFASTYDPYFGVAKPADAPSSKPAAAKGVAASPVAPKRVRSRSPRSKRP